MNAPGPLVLRRAGTGRAPDGRTVTWSVADGARGRRWRWSLTTGEGSLVHAGLIELDPEGRFGRLELAAAAGLLTLHPAPDGRSAHGNVVRRDRVDPIEIPWSRQTSIALNGDPFGTAIAGWRGRGWLVRDDLTLVSISASQPVIMLDQRGVPILSDTVEWPLEI